MHRVLLRVLHFSPSTATGRHDSHRAALGFLSFVRDAASEFAPDIRSELVWALPAITSAAGVAEAMSGADLLVVATPVYGQGSPWFVRKFLEQTRGLQLWGVLGTAFASAGGTHTGGETAILDTFRSLQGAGLCTFTFAQKLVVFAAQQKPLADGEFEPVDAWFLRQLARTCVVQLMARRGIGPEWAAKLGIDSAYYLNFPGAQTLEQQVGERCRRMNAPLSNGVSAYDWWSDQLGFDARPPDASALPFFSLLPEAMPV
jgi:hypothetical protein